MAAVPTKEELEAALEIVKQFGGATDEVLGKGAEALTQFTSAYRLLQNAYKATEENLNDLQQKVDQLEGNEKRAMEEKIAREQEYLEFKQNNTTRLKETLAAQNAEYELASKKALEKIREIGEAHDEQVVRGQRSVQERIQGGATAAAQTTAQAVEIQAKLLGEVLSNVTGYASAAAIKALVGVGPSIGAISTEMSTLGGDIEKAQLAFTKLGLTNPELQRLQLLATDTGAAVASKLNPELARFDGLLGGTGLKVGEVNSVMLSLVKGSPAFRRALEIDPAAVVALGNYGAVLKQLGVSNENFTKTIDFKTAVMKEDAETALATTLAHKNMARQLGIDSDTIFTNFTSARETIAKFGADGNEVFSDLQVVSTRTGIAFDSLQSDMMKFDDFKTATETAQKFNAVLRETGVRISPEKLFRMDPAEKARYLGEKMKEAGVFSEEMGRKGRFMASALGGITGIKVPDLRRMADPKALALTAKELDNTRQSAIALSEETLKSLSAQELHARGVQNLVKDASALVPEARARAKDLGTAWIGGIENAQRQIDLPGAATLAVAAGAKSAAALTPDPIAAVKESLGEGAGRLATPMIATGQAAIGAGGLGAGAEQRFQGRPRGAAEPGMPVEDAARQRRDRTERERVQHEALLRAIEEQTKTNNKVSRALSESQEVKVTGEVNVKGKGLGSLVLSGKAPPPADR